MIASPHHFLYQAAAWLARQVGTDLLEVPGGHMAYLTEPVAVAESAPAAARVVAEPRTRRGINLLGAVMAADRAH